ncbi:hypothetical protein [Candidatus Thiodiazotropha sp. CDECU1]|uniref:hypothetical protein n=1 Tax=Candidatus Thiodiazotropha sp. CDECU1 TaxID=3065865 RepID=UPI002930B115|nr:hypothetical protein [Candidatus Thiodiazotropha sp. CDECU1]
MSKTDRKPDTRTAMRQLIDRVRRDIPFDLPEEVLCGDTCQGCSGKVLIYLETELDEWEGKLANGAIPNFSDLCRLAEKSKKIARVLHQNGLLKKPPVS